MGRRRLAVVAIGPAALVAAAGPATSTVPTKCPKGKIARVANGKKACVSATAYRQRVTRITSVASGLQRALAGGPITLRLKNGRVVANVIRPKLAAATAIAYTAAEAELTLAVRAAMGQTANGRPHEIRDPTLAVNRGTDGSVSGSITKTVAADGQRLTMKQPG